MASAAVALAFASCGGGSSSHSSSGPTTTPSSAPSTTEAPSTSTVHKIGETGTTSGGTKVTLFAWQWPAQPSSSLGPSAGNQFGAADVQVCQSPHPSSGAQREFPFGPTDFEVQLASNRRVSATFGGPQPGLNTTTLAPSECVRGWVTFSIPQTEDPSDLLWNPLGTSLLKWSLK